MTPRTVRVNVLDRPWNSTLVTSLVGPVAMPERSVLVHAIVELAMAFPQSRLGWQLDSTAAHWSWDPDPARVRARAEHLVATTDDDPSLDYSGWLTRFSNRRDLAWPTSFLLAPNHLGMRNLHGVGDGRTTTMFLSGVLKLATTGVMPDWPTAPGIDHPYREALWSFFGRSPSRVVQAAKAIRPARAPRAATQDAPWTPMPVSLYRQMSAERMAEVRAWRSHRARGSSMPAIELSLILKAFRAAGTPLHPEVLTLFDARRYIPRSQVDGNFVVGLLLPLSARSTVAEIGNAMDAAGESGRPLTALGLGMLVRRRPGATPSTAPIGATAQLAFSHMGRPQHIERAKFLPTSAPVYIGSIDPGHPTGLTIATTQTGGRLHLSTTCHANVLDVDSVARALDVLITDPVALLDESETSFPSLQSVAVMSGGSR